MTRAPLPLAALAVGVALAAGSASAQTATPVFDEDDGGSTDAYEASQGFVSDPASVALSPNGFVPITSGDAASGSDYGVLTYASQGDGRWSVVVGAPGFGPLDLSAADSVVVFLNGPVGVPGVSLPRLGLEDADGDRTVGVPLDFGTRVGFNGGGSGFLDGSTTDARFVVDYVDSLPADLARPGYPESIRITFSDDVVSSSTASIGVPSVPARFTVETEGGVALPFQFRDTDGDGTLSRSDESITVLTQAEGFPGLRQTWRVRPSATPAESPAAGDAYRLAVFNSGVDDDPATWQRRAVSVSALGPLGDVDISQIRGVVFESAASATAERTVWFDAVSALAYDGSPQGPAPPSDLTTEAGNGTVALRWTPAGGADGVVVFRQRPGEPYVRITPDVVRFDHFFDLDARNGETARYVLRSIQNNGLRGSIQGPDSDAVSATATASAPDPYIDATARRAFDYFWESGNPANGLVPDRVTPTGPSASSIAAVGFGLSAYTVGADRGWITRNQAAGRTLATLEFLASCPQGDAPSGTCGYKGFFYHFLTLQTGVRAGTNELSTIDTALLLGGVLHAAQYYDGADADETRIRQLADRVWRRVDWQWATNRDPLVTLGWKPEDGFNICNGGLCDWNGYNEAAILYIMGLGSPTSPLRDDAWEAWTAGYQGQWQTHYGYTFLVFPPLFGHQYSHLWIDFRNTQDAYMRDRGITYFENSIRATRASRAYAVENPGRYPNYSATEWGLTASDDPFGYRAHGAPPAQADNGTITPTATGGSYAFTPDISREALREMYRKYYARLWGRYGLKDAYNIAEDWFASDYIGIDQGPIVLMIENHRTEALWDSFMGHPDIRRGMERAGFTLPPVSAEDAEPGAPVVLRPPAPNPSSGAVRLAFDLAEAGPVRLSVYDALGRQVAVLRDGPLAAGPHGPEWSGTVAAGVYVVRLEAAGRVLTRTFVITR